MMKILTIVGARPQFVKAAVVSRNIAKIDTIKEYILHTGQHYDYNMSKVFFQEMEIPLPHFHLNIHGGGHGAMTGRMLEGIEAKIQELKPDAVLVYGDTNSTMAGALAAKKLHRQVIHVEAGLRSFNMAMPEEINRILTDRVSDVLFCPTKAAVNNLIAEGYQNFNCEIVLSGDVMQDAMFYYQKKANAQSTILHENHLEEGKYILCTIHRAENTDDLHRLMNIVEGLNIVHDTVSPVIIPLHPRTRAILQKENIEARFKIIDPVGYFDMIKLISNAKLICTDSGGLQKEAFFCDKYCVTLRDETEWAELIQGNYNKLVGADKGKLISTVEMLIRLPFPEKNEMYGGGKAGKMIAGYLRKLNF